jgi:hypothetical protein
MAKRTAIAASFVLLGLVQIASADIFGTVSFKTPVVTVSNTASIPVYLTLTLDPNSDPLITDASGNVTSLTTTQIAANVFGTFYDSTSNCNGGGCPISGYTPDFTNDIFSSDVDEGYLCSGITFFSAANICGGGTSPYNFTFGPGPGLDFATNVNLAPGSSTSYLFGTFTPAAGSVPAGTYTLPDAFYFMQVYDDTQTDTNGQPVHIADITLGDTSNSAGFTADVVGTPEPSFYGVLAVGLMGLLAVRIRKIA